MQADCLERLVGVAQRAPRVRRLSWSFLGAKKTSGRWEDGGKTDGKMVI